MEEIKLANGITVLRWENQIELSWQFYGNANKAVKRRLRKFARSIRLYVCEDAIGCTCVIWSAKDQHRANELIRFASGKSITRTANNNRNRWTGGN